ncbi:MAG: hypothetical protein H0X28_12660 [Solirubrobacterales bacterium]|nr:hypothetical protein [Solirubrobacterales bacterium]
MFVLDRSEGGRVYKFNAAGEPVNLPSSSTNVIEGVGSASGSEEELAVDSSSGPAAGDIYVANNSVVKIYAASGVFLGELTGPEPCGVAVDPSGKVYVGSFPETVKRYTPTSNPVTNADEPESMGGLEKVCNVAVDGSGNVYAANYLGGVTKYDALQFGSLTASGELVDPGGRTLAVDPVSGEAFIDEVSQLAQYEGSAEPPARLGTSGGSGEGALSGSFGVGVSHETGDLYAANRQTVEIFGPGVVVAAASTEAATGISSSEATLHGTVEPSGTEVTSCIFEYGTQAGALNQTAPCEPAPPYTGSPVAVSAQVTGLNVGTTYRYRIVASGASGAASGAEESLRTAGPRIDSEEAQEGELRANSALVRAQIDPGGEATTYRVEYGTSASYGSTTAPVELEAGEGPVGVKVHIAGLQANTTYHFRFVAVNAAGTATGHDVTFTTLSIVRNESFSSVGSSSAALSAEIDPGGEATTYHVEYGVNTAYGSSTQSIGVGSGESPVSVVSRLEELQSGTTYHFRFVATKAAGSETGPDLVFTTHPRSAPGLPDLRGYEMVTPVDNQGGEPYSPAGSGREGEDAISTSYISLAADDGKAVAYAGSPSSSGNGNQGNGGGNQFLAVRDTGGGWTQTDIQPKGHSSPTYWAFSSDLQAGILLSGEPLVAGTPRGYPDLYERNNTDGSYKPLSVVQPPNRSTSEFGASTLTGYVTQLSLGEHYAGASADFSHQLFEVNDALTVAAVDPGPGANNLYDSAKGQLRSVNVLPDGTPAPNAAFGATEVDAAARSNFSHVISNTGTRIFWTDMNTGSLYLRENDAATSLISEAATYLTASADGSRVLYTKAGDLYEEDVETHVTKDLAPGGQVQGLMGAGEDLGYIYFVADAALDGAATAGQPNLYVLHGTATTFIATLGTASEETTQSVAPEAYPWQASEGWRTAEVTPSGQSVVFMSTRPLTGYDNVSRSDPAEPIADPEIYVYDAIGGRVSCTSCDPTGQAPTGHIGLARLGGILPISRQSTYQLHLISDDGDRVFFESLQPLLPQAANGKLNVYEWERDGTGTCSYANGCIYLLSSGSSATASYLVDASATGSDAFLMTRSQLVTSDKNEYNDIYDARVGVIEAATPTQCTGTGCQGVPAMPPVFATPASTTFAGVGNFSSPATPVAKPRTKPKKKLACATKKKRKRPKARKSAEQAKAKPVPCKARKAAKRARHGKGRNRG